MKDFRIYQTMNNGHDAVIFIIKIIKEGVSSPVMTTGVVMILGIFSSSYFVGSPFFCRNYINRIVI
jgi:hypothetical protein